MGALPIRRNQFKVSAFCAWLTDNGCEVGKPTNEWEVVRYRAYRPESKRPITHIVYAKQTGLLNWMEGTKGHYHSFLAGRAMAWNAPPYESRFDKPDAPAFVPIPDAPKPTKPTKPEHRRAKLLKRDGPDCWFCGRVMGDDCTIEHLVPKSKDGPNSLANFALAHAKCNRDAADLPLVDKIALRERLRSERVL